jgi:RimJ/RimL family protein N-acetyltransferase
VNVSIRRASPDDLDFLTELLAHVEVQPFLAAARATDREGIETDIARSSDKPDEFGLFMIEVDGVRAGTMRYVRSSERNRIADLGGLAVHPDFRGRRIADDAARLFQRHLLEDLGFHRLQLEVYGFNERAIGHAERSGFVYEGRKRRAYERHGEWVDGVLFGFTQEDLAKTGEPTPLQ